MKRKHIVLVSVLAVGLMGLLLALLMRKKQLPANEKTALTASPTTTTQQDSPNSVTSAGTPRFSRKSEKSEIESRKEAVKIIQGIYGAPISFYGKVIDQKGMPVSRANVDYNALDKFMTDGSKYRSLSDDNGDFSITDIKGAGLLVSVSKPGYDRIDGKSAADFGYGMPPDSYRKAPPTKDHPAVFVLRKKSEAEPLIVINCNIPIPKNGSPVEISLKTGMRVSAGQGDLKIECWTNDQTKDAKRQYEWHCRFSVPGGGLVERGGELEQQAPVDGYKADAEIHMKQNAQSWRPSFEGEYFLKLSNGSYARARLEMIAGGDHFASIASYLNPQPSSRNLEYDASKQAPDP